MLTDEQCDALIDSALADPLSVVTLPAPPPSPSATSEPPSVEPEPPHAGGDLAVVDPDRDIRSLEPMLAPVTGPRAELERLGDRIAELSSRIQAATYDLLVLIREFDAQSGWSGFTSCAHWLSWRTGLAPGAAREHVRVARALGHLPRLSAAMQRGAVSYSKVRAVTRVATPETEQSLLDAAQSGTAAHVEQIVRGWRRVDRAAEQTNEQRRQDRRSLRTWVDEDGMVVVQGRLTPEVGAVLRRALEAACDMAQAQRDAAAEADLNSEAADVAAAEEKLAPSFAQRQADAIGVVAESALAGGLDRGTAGDRYQVVLHVDAGALEAQPDVSAGTSEQAAHEAAVDRDANGVPAGTPETTARDVEPVEDGVYVPAGTYTSAEPQLAHDSDGEGVPAGTPAGGGRQHRRSPGPCQGPSTETKPEPAVCSQTVLDEDGGIHVSAATARRLACDAAKVEMQHGVNGEILDVGRRTRTISPALRRALASRDGHCRFPGCRNRRTDAHHLVHWADGGETVLENLVLLCRRHHRAVHEEGFRITLDAAGEVAFTRPDGRPFPQAAPPPLWTGEALAPVNERLEQEGIEIDAHTATPRWKGERVDMNWTVDLLWRPPPDAPLAHTKS